MKKKKQKLWQPIILGFAVLYLAAMGLATWLVERKFEEDYRNYYKNRMETLYSAADKMNTEPEEGTQTREELLKRFQLLTTGIQLGPDKDAKMQMSMALYDESGRLIFEGQNLALSYPLGSETYREFTELMFSLSDYLPEKELRQLAEYRWISMEEWLQRDDPSLPESYDFFARIDPDTLELCGLIAQKLTWEKNAPAHVNPVTNIAEGYNGYGQTGSEVVWEWTNPEVSEEMLSSCRIETVTLSFPYLTYGYDAWLKWEQNEYLHDFEPEIELKDGYSLEDYNEVFYRMQDGAYESAPFQARVRSVIPVYYNMSGSDAHWNLLLAMDSHPWPAAMDYMKYVYLACFVLMLVCMLLIICMTRRTYEQRAAMEEMRRDFTNAMAHELKTPLGVIRGFAENLQEGTMEAKKDYYLAQIIGQTEEMDRIASEMIAVSKMDSDHLVLQKDPVSLSGLFREQMERFSPVITEKNLRITYDCGEDFTVEGDRDYLSKAVWNLISNAAAYNVPGGSILIRTEPAGCSIENTGVPLTEEQLAHAFDMFYRGDESRSSQDKHMGLGLFLTKKILELHHLKISLENTPDGVCARIRR